MIMRLPTLLNPIAFNTFSNAEAFVHETIARDQ